MSAPEPHEPKAIAACAICDDQVREILAWTPAPKSRPHRMGGYLPGVKTATLVHLDSSYSEHSLCAQCSIQPAHLPVLWRRACALARESVEPGQDEQLRRYAENIPLGILHVRPAV